MDNRKKGWLQAALVLMVIAAAVALSQWVASFAEPPVSRDEAGQRIIEVSAERIESVAHHLHFVATGTIRVKSYVRLVPEVSGRVIAVDDAVYAGGHFDAGTVLFRIDPRDYEAAAAEREAAVARARRALQQTRAEVETAKRQWRRLHPGTEPSPLVARRPQLEEARAALEAAKSALLRAKRDLERTRFALPFGGRVVESNIEKGQFVTAGQSYGRAYREDALEVRAPVTARQREWLVRAEDAQIAIRVLRDEERTDYQGAFERVGAEAEPETRLLDAIFSFVRSPSSAVPGEFAEVKVIGPEIDSAWVLPIRALQEDGVIWLVDDANRLRSFEPDILNITEDHVLAASNGETIVVVTQPLRTATEGTKVEVQDDP